MATRKISTAAALAAESNELINHMTRYTKRNYGPRCEEYEPDCCVCRMWKARDDMKAFICD